VEAAAENLPGADLVRSGLSDLQAGRESEASLLVQIAAPRLRRLGIEIPDTTGRADGPAEHRLYELLARDGDRGAHSRYNALLARIASYASAAEHASPR
jgi:hypothetical protein